jgi:hypothetical protein
MKWPLYSPNRNPLEYSVWWVLVAKISAKCHRNMEKLERSLMAVGEEIDEDYLRASVDYFPKFLKACIEANGGQFQNC